MNRSRLPGRRLAVVAAVPVALGALLAGCSSAGNSASDFEGHDQLRAAPELHAELDPADRHVGQAQHQQRVHRAVALGAAGDL